MAHCLRQPARTSIPTSFLSPVFHFLLAIGPIPVVVSNSMQHVASADCRAVCWQSSKIPCSHACQGLCISAITCVHYALRQAQAQKAAGGGRRAVQCGFKTRPDVGL
eukprot:5232139-Lingulodinium_polyedra.AAC.1